MKEYFSHDLNARNDLKLKKLFKEYKLAGIGAYWCIIEMLHEENGKIPLSEIENISYDLRVKPEFILNILKNFELFSSDSENFWSESANVRIEKKKEKSIKARESINNRWKKDTNVLQPYSDKNTIKLKESKLKESKLKETLPPQKNDYLKNEEEEENPGCPPPENLQPLPDLLFQNWILGTKDKYTAVRVKDMPAIQIFASAINTLLTGIEKMPSEFDVGERKNVIIFWDKIIAWYLEIGCTLGLDLAGLEKFKMPVIFNFIQNGITKSTPNFGEQTKKSTSESRIDALAKW